MEIDYATLIDRFTDAILANDPSNKATLEEIEDFTLATKILESMINYIRRVLKMPNIYDEYGYLTRAEKVLTKSRDWLVMANNATTGVRSTLAYNSVLWYRNDLQRMLILHISTVESLKFYVDSNKKPSKEKNN